MTQPAARQPVTFAEYVELERTSEIKHQLVDGELFDMSGGTPEHAALILSVGSSLKNQLRGRPCRPFSSELRVRAGDLTTYPDCSVVCGPLERHPQDSSTILNPTLLVEVLSDSTEAFDRGRKFEQYRRIPSLREYVLVRQDEPHIEVYTREAQGWVLREAGRGEKIGLASIGCELDVDSVYEGVFETRG